MVECRCTTGPALPGWSIEVDTTSIQGRPTRRSCDVYFEGDADDPAIWAPLRMEDVAKGHEGCCVNPEGHSHH